MAWGDREQKLNIPNAGINRADLNPATLIRRIIPGTGILLSGTGVGDETIMAASPAAIWAGMASDANILSTPGGFAWDINSLSSGPGDYRDDLVMRLTAASPAQTSLDFYAGDAATSAEEFFMSWYKRSDWPYYGQFVISAATEAVIYRTKEQDTGWSHQFHVHNRMPLEIDYNWVNVNQPIRWDTEDFQSYSSGDNEYIFWIGDEEKHWLGADLHAFQKDAGGNVTVGIRAAGTPAEIQLRDDDVGAWRSLSDFVLTTRSLSAGSGLTGGGSLSADRTFHVGAGTGIMTNLNAVYAASPCVFTTRTLTAGSYLSGGGDLSADRRFDFNHATLGTLLAGTFYTETEVDTFVALAASKSITLTAGTGSAGGGDLSANRTFSAASPVIWWHNNAATPSIHEIRPLTSSTTARWGYDSVDKRWWLGTGEQYEIMQADAGTMVVSASYGIRLAGPTQRYFSFDSGYDCLKYDTVTNELKYHVGSDTHWSALLGATGMLKLAMPSATLTLSDVSASGTLTDASGYLTVMVGGQTRYIPLYATIV